MTGRELAAVLLALPNPDLPIEQVDDEGNHYLLKDPVVVEQRVSQAHYEEDWTPGLVFGGYHHYGTPQQKEVWVQGFLPKRDKPERLVIIIA